MGIAKQMMFEQQAREERVLLRVVDQDEAEYDEAIEKERLLKLMASELGFELKDLHEGPSK